MLESWASDFSNRTRRSRCRRSKGVTRTRINRRWRRQRYDFLVPYSCTKIGVPKGKTFRIGNVRWRPQRGEYWSGRTKFRARCAPQVLKRLLSFPYSPAAVEYQPDGLRFEVLVASWGCLPSVGTSYPPFGKCPQNGSSPPAIFYPCVGDRASARCAQTSARHAPGAASVPYKTKGPIRSMVNRSRRAWRVPKILTWAITRQSCATDWHTRWGDRASYVICLSSELTLNTILEAHPRKH